MTRKWYWAQVSRDIPNHEIGNGRFFDVQGLRRLYTHKGERRAFAEGESCRIAKQYGKHHKWIAVFADGSVLGFSDGSARKHLTTERIEGRPVRVNRAGALKAELAYIAYEDSLRPVSCGA
jgi:hypothetical protein